MKRNLICFLALIISNVYVIIANGQPEYSFKEERVRNVKRSGPDKYSEDVLKQHYFNTLETKTRTHDLCNDSNLRNDLCEFVRTSNSFSINYYWIETTDFFDFEDLNGNVKTEVAIQCSTMPYVWLRLGSSNTEIVQTFLAHVAENYEFEHEFYESIQLVHPTAYQYFHRSALESSPLASYEYRDCDYFCFFAHKRLELFNPDERRKNLDDSIIADTATLYNVRYKIPNKKESDGIPNERENAKILDQREYVVIRCHTEPHMYLRLADEGDNKMIAMLQNPEVANKPFSGRSRMENRAAEFIELENPGPGSPKTELVTYLQAGDVQPTPMWIDIGTMRITVTVSTGTYRTLLSGAAYDRLIRSQRHYRNAKLQPVTNIKLVDLMGNQIKIRGSVRLKCRAISKVGQNYVPLEPEFIVTDTSGPDGIFGMKDLSTYDTLFIGGLDVLVFRQSTAPRAITLVDGTRDPDEVAAAYFEKEMSCRSH